MVVCAVATLTPTVIFPELVVAHVPTFLGLLGFALSFARRSRHGESISPVAIAAVVGGLFASVALMLIPLAAMHEDPKSIGIYWYTWILLPVFAIVGSGIGAAMAVLCRLVFPPVSRA